MIINSNFTMVYRWFLFPWKLVRYITNKNHSEIGVINAPTERYRTGAPPCGNHPQKAEVNSGWSWNMIIFSQLYVLLSITGDLNLPLSSFLLMFIWSFFARWWWWWMVMVNIGFLRIQTLSGKVQKNLLTIVIIPQSHFLRRYGWIHRG